jgi:Zn-finger nucleic acid-binding protein
VSDEDEYFRKLDQEAKARLQRKLMLEQADHARKERAALHRNRCGKCGGEIEVCQDCAAVLLDPGELEQLAGKDQTETFTSFFSMFGQRKP